MGRYRLPISLGGLQHDAASDEPAHGMVGFDLPGVSKRLWLDRVDLVPIHPVEPPLFAVVVVGILPAGDEKPKQTLDAMVFQHRPFRAAGAWFRAGSSRAHSWPEVCSYGAPLVLTKIDRSVLRYAVEVLAASSDNGDQYCAQQIRDAISGWDERQSNDQ